jgi:hypothetical protein
MRRLAVCVAAGAMLLFASPARADDTYATVTCRGGADRTVSIDGWTGSGFLERRNACGSGGDLSAGPALRPFAQLEGAAWSFTAPPDTRITAFTLFRTVRMEASSSWAWNWSLLKDRIEGVAENYVETCWAMSGCYALGDGTARAGSRVERSGLDIGALHGWVDCNPGGCPVGSGASLIRIHRADFSLRDVADPVFSGTPSGDLLDTANPVSGERSLSFSATDRGGGIYQAQLEIDGRVVVRQTVDDNGGRCRLPFSGAVPCKLAASGTLGYNTARLADGEHSIRLIVNDATQTNRAAYGPVRVRTANQTTGCVAGAAPGLTARFASTRRSALTRRRGRPVTLVGSLSGAAPGTAVVLLSREVRTGAPRVVAASAVTGTGGAFRLRAPAGRSRTLQVAYRPAPTERLLRCSRALRLRVPARASLTAQRRALRRFRMSGRLAGGAVPRRGKLVELQAFERGRWNTFRTLRTRASGRFATTYRFSPASTGRRFRLRVRVRPDASYPFSLGYSRVVSLRVR